MMNSNVTYFPDLFRWNTSKSTIVDPSDPFISSEVLSNRCSIFSDHPDGLPKDLCPNRKLLNDLTYFPEDEWEKIRKLQDGRENELKKEDLIEDMEMKLREEKEKEITKELDMKATSEMQKFRKFIRRSCPVKIPYKSSLTHEEHEAYLKAFIKFQTRAPKTTMEDREYQRYLMLQDVVFREQSDLMQFSYKVAQTQLSTYNNVPEVIRQYIQDYTFHRLERVKRYPDVYTHEQEIPIVPQDPDKKFSSLNFSHIGHALSLGLLYPMWIPTESAVSKLSINDHLLARTGPFVDDMHDSEAYLYKTPVSSDPNAECIAREHDVDIVMSSSTFHRIVNNQGPTFEKDWDIPLSVKLQEVKDSQGKVHTKRIVYIDKPLPRQTWLPLEEKQKYFKASCLKHFRHRKLRPHRFLPPSSFVARFTMPERSFPSITTYDDGLFDITAEYTKDTFGEASSPTRQNWSNSQSKKRKKRKERACKPSNTAVHDSSSESSFTSSPSKRAMPSECENASGTASDVGQTTQHLPSKRDVSSLLIHPSQDEGQCLDDRCSEVGTPASSGFLDGLLTQQESMLKTSWNKSFDASHANSGTSQESVPNLLPWSNSLSSKWEVTELKMCPPQSPVNVHYQLFQLGFNKNSEHPSCRASSFLGFKILIRHNVHGIKHVQSQQPKAFIFYPKIENQLYFGCEVNALSEITHQWAELVVRPNTTLVQVRSCANDGTVIMSEERSLATILKEGKQPHINFQPSQPLATLYSVCSTVAKLKAGQYLLHHSSVKNEAFIQLKKSADSEGRFDFSGTFSIQKAYNLNCVRFCAYTSPPWLAIDTHILTPFHMRHKKIPATFPMRITVKLTKAQKKELKRKRKGQPKKKTIEEYGL